MTGHPAVSSQPTLAPLVVLDVAKAARSFSSESPRLTPANANSISTAGQKNRITMIAAGDDEDAPTEAERRSTTNGLIWQP
jgi:hypothetical protein